MKTYRWFIEPDPKTNRVISDKLGSDMALAEYQGKKCSDGKSRDLLEVSKTVVDNLASMQKAEKLHYKVFRQFGENLPRWVATFVVGVESPALPVGVAKGESSFPSVVDTDPLPF